MERSHSLQDHGNDESFVICPMCRGTTFNNMESSYKMEWSKGMQERLGGLFDPGQKVQEGTEVSHKIALPVRPWLVTRH